MHAQSRDMTRSSQPATSCMPITTAGTIAARRLRKVVVITGANVPYAIRNSDAEANLRHAIELAQTLPLAGVYIACEGKALSLGPVRIRWQRLHAEAGSSGERDRCGMTQGRPYEVRTAFPNCAPCYRTDSYPPRMPPGESTICQSCVERARKVPAQQRR